MKRVSLFLSAVYQKNLYLQIIYFGFYLGRDCGGIGEGMGVLLFYAEWQSFKTSLTSPTIALFPLAKYLNLRIFAKKLLLFLVCFCEPFFFFLREVSAVQLL